MQFSEITRLNTMTQVQENSTTYLCKKFPMKVLMVCLGNICRSPIAEGVLQQKVKQLGLDWEVESAGTNGYHNGERPHEMSQMVSKLNGIDISGQRSRPFRAEDFEQYDLIIPMAADVWREMKYIAGKKYNAAKVELLLNYSFPKTDLDVPDPWGRSVAAFHEVFNLIDHACEALIKQYQSPKQP
jgi:protein-tyrosine phosphatase